MKRAMTLIVVMSVLLFSQLALAEWKFQPGELTEIWGGEVQDQGLADQQLAAAGLRIVPLQVYTHYTSNINEAAVPWWHLDQEFYATVALRIYGSGDYSSSLTITDVKTGKSVKFRYGSESITEEGFSWWTYGPMSVSGDASKLPRTFKLTYSYKVGTIVTSVSTKIMLIAGDGLGGF
jgi:hypothetical protein